MKNEWPEQLIGGLLFLLVLWFLCAFLFFL